jgi:hypothetical protein
MDTLALTLTASSDSAMDKTLAELESLLAPALAAQIKDRVKGIHLRSEALELDVDVPGAGSLRVQVNVSVTGPG